MLILVPNSRAMALGHVLFLNGGDLSSIPFGPIPDAHAVVPIVFLPPLPFSIIRTIWVSRKIHPPSAAFFELRLASPSRRAANQLPVSVSLTIQQLRQGAPGLGCGQGSILKFREHLPEASQFCFSNH